MVPLTQLPSHLPDLCLLNIFKRVPLFDLLDSVRVVCTNWYRVAPTELSHRRSLVLFRYFSTLLEYQVYVKLVREGENPFRSDLIEHVRREDGAPWVRLCSIDQIWFDILRLSTLTERFASSLMATLPTITHLTLYQRVSRKSIISVLEQIARLINHYEKDLFSLKIDISGYQVDQVPEQPIICTVLVDSINQLESLRHLTLNIKGLKLTSELLSILSRLDTFTSKYIATCYMDSICQYANIGNVRIASDGDLDLEELIALEPQLATKFTVVSVSNILSAADYDHMRHLSARFASLTRLFLFIDTMPMTMLAKCLSPLNQLIYLVLDFDQISPTPAQLEFTQVSSVRLLSLLFHSKSHLDTERLYIAEIFVNLQVIDIHQQVDCCVECGLSNVGLIISFCLRDDARDRTDQCRRLSLHPFRQCAKLHTIKFEGNLLVNNLITREQFGKL